MEAVKYGRQSGKCDIIMEISFNFTRSYRCAHCAPPNSTIFERVKNENYKNLINPGFGLEPDGMVGNGHQGSANGNGLYISGKTH